MSSLVAPSVGWRLAGLADGEGSFGIYRLNAGGGHTSSYRCSFTIKLRADDRRFLGEMCGLVGLGSVRFARASNRDGARRQPNVLWVVQRKRECLSLTEIFDRYPLWSKKAADYAIWREAAIYWAHCGGGLTDWTPLIEWQQRLAAVRIYRPLEVVENG